jgi:hypothetical protein
MLLHQYQPNKTWHPMYAQTLVHFHFISHRSVLARGERENAGGHEGVAEGYVVVAVAAAPMRPLAGA